MIGAGRMVGNEIGSYRVIGPAVPWPLADVYLGQDTRTGQAVDIILLPADSAASAGGADQFLAELRAVLAFRHPGFAHLLDCDRLTDGAFYLVNEHVEAERLSERLRRDGGLASDLVTVREVVGQTAAALEAAHNAGLLYLCLRPESMLLVPATQRGLPVTVRLLGLGLGSHFLSRIRQMAPGKELPASMLRYASPEQCRGSGADHRSDIYALGCILFELLVDRPPFRETEIWGLVSAHAHEVPPRIHELRPELPPALDDLVATMLEKDPGQRPFCMGEIIAVLRAAVREPAASLEAAESPASAPITRTAVLDPESLVPPLPAEDLQSTPAFRPTRLLTPAEGEGAVAPLRPAAVVSPPRALRDLLPASTEPASAQRRPTPPPKRRGGSGGVRRVSRVPILVVVTLVCLTLGVGLFLWFLRPKAPEARHAPVEETPARQPSIPPPVPPSPTAVDIPTPSTQRPAAELGQPKPEPTDKPRSNLGRNRLPRRRTRSQDPANLPALEFEDGVLPPSFPRK